jgi:hypothetical protein
MHGHECPTRPERKEKNQQIIDRSNTRETGLALI